MSFNKITIVGNLGANPQVKFTPQGQQVCEFSVATNEKKANDQVETTWFHISLWGKLAETIPQYLHKGKEVYIEGRLRVREWTDREGQRRYTLEVNATDLRLVGNSENSHSNSYRQEEITQKPIPQQKPEVEDVRDVKTVEEKVVTKAASKSRTARSNAKVSVKDPFETTV